MRSLTITSLLILPALVLRFGGLHPAPVLSLVIYGAAVVAASFLLAWAAEAAQIDVSGGLAIAVLALIAVLPEYAVDLYYAYTAGSNPEYAQYAAANMTGSNRLLMGIGWPIVVLVSLYVARRVTGKPVTQMVLDPGNRVELGFLMVAGVAAFIIPVTGQINLVFGIALLAWFGFYLYKLTRGDVEEPELIGTAAAIGALPQRNRRTGVIALFVLAAAVILACAEPFAESLVGAGTQLGIDKFLLVQWLAPLASEAPEFIIAIIFAARGKGTAAIATLISSKVNQWTLLVGSLPIAHMAGGRHIADARRTPGRGDVVDRDADDDGYFTDSRAAVPPVYRVGVVGAVHGSVPDYLHHRSVGAVRGVRGAGRGRAGDQPPPPAADPAGAIPAAGAIRGRARTSPRRGAGLLIQEFGRLWGRQAGITTA